MSNTLKLDNFPENNYIEAAMIDEDSAVGAVAIKIKGDQSFRANYFALLGTPAEENTEIREITDVTNSIMTVPATANKHKKYDNVALIFADKLQIWKATSATSPAIGTYVKYGEPISLDYDNLQTRYVDPSGGDTDWYAYTFINTITDEETDLSDSQFIQGGYTIDYASIWDIRVESRTDGNPFISDIYIAGKRAKAEGHINSVLSGHYTVPFTNPIPVEIERLTIAFAAGYIMQRELGRGANTPGSIMIKDADADLLKIANGDTSLGDDTSGDGGSLSGGKVRGWPNAQTATTPLEESGGRRKIRAGMRF